MNHNIIKAPPGVRYIGDWVGFWNLFPNEPLMLNKRQPGCGFTQDAITNDDFDIVLAAPRRALLETKHKKHPETFLFLPPGSSLPKSCSNGGYTGVCSLRDALNTYLANNNPDNTYSLPFESIVQNKSRKILTTYDSLPKVVDILAENGILHEFTFIIDECQNLLIDSFKAQTEWKCLSCLDGLKKVIYVSATPIEEDYLELVDQFKNLPYYEIEWDESVLSSKPLFLRKYTKMTSEIGLIVGKYRSGHSGFSKVWNGRVEESREAVIFINEVSTIVNVLKDLKITSDEANIICAQNAENAQKLAAIGFKIGNIPDEGDAHKMFTFCTSTVYMGVDFCSTNAVTFIFAEAKRNTLMVDIACEVPQIQGRQRLDENPFRHDVFLYVHNDMMDEPDWNAFDERIKNKLEAANALLDIYNNSSNEVHKKYLLSKYRNSVKTQHYSEDYIDVVDDIATGKENVVINKLVMASEIRAMKLLRANYQNDQTILNATAQVSCMSERDRAFEKDWLSTNDFSKRMKLYCEAMADGIMADHFCFIDCSYHQYYLAFGPEKLKAMRYREGRIKMAIQNISQQHNIKSAIETDFIIGNWYSASEIKDKLNTIFTAAGLKNKKAKATDISQYLDVKPEQHKKKRGYRILNTK